MRRDGRDQGVRRAVADAGGVNSGTHVTSSLSNACTGTRHSTQNGPIGYVVPLLTLMRVSDVFFIHALGAVCFEHRYALRLKWEDLCWRMMR